MALRVCIGCLGVTGCPARLPIGAVSTGCLVMDTLGPEALWRIGGFRAATASLQVLRQKGAAWDYTLEEA